MWALTKLMAAAANEQARAEFQALGKDGPNYTEAQKEFALSLVDTHGVRATAKILQIPRITLQRWSRKHGQVQGCPDWVISWAERRRKYRERHGYS